MAVTSTVICVLCVAKVTTDLFSMKTKINHGVSTNKIMVTSYTTGTPWFCNTMVGICRLNYGNTNGSQYAKKHGYYNCTIIKTWFIFVRVEYFSKKIGGKTSTSLLSSHQCCYLSIFYQKCDTWYVYGKKTLSESELVTCFPLSP